LEDLVCPLFSEPGGRLAPPLFPIEGAMTSATAESVFLFDVQGSVAKSTFAGLPWLLYMWDWCQRPIHF
jgi:hypothetical protein